MINLRLKIKLLKMHKRRHSVRTTTVVVEEKRSRRWPQCLSLKNLQKLAAATGLCCYKSKNVQASVRPHPVLRRAQTDSVTENSQRLSQNENNLDKGATLTSIESDTSLCSGVDYVQKTIECPLNDAQLQRDIWRVVDRLNYLLNLADNGNGPSNFSECNSPGCTTAANDTREVQRHEPFKATWDKNSTSLCIKLVPPQSNTPTNCHSRSERSDSDFSCNQSTVATFNSQAGTPYIFHRRLSARISADSGFFSTLLNFFNNFEFPPVNFKYYFCIIMNWKDVIVVKKQFC